MNSRIRLGLLYSIAFLGSIASTFLTMGIFYFTLNRWAWDARSNLSLAAGQGVAYAISALLAHAVSSRLGRRKALVLLAVVMGGIPGVAALFASHAIASICLIVYMLFTGMYWPMLESLCAETSDPHEMSRRLGAYNLTWAVSGAIALLSTGLLIEHWPAGIFILPLALHWITAVLTLLLLWQPAPQTQAAHIEPEPQLLRSRTQALWLSRIALPAMYVVNFGLSAIMPVLPGMKELSPTVQTLVGSIWVAARTVMFAILMATVFWHTRPRLLLGSSIAMLGAFLLITLVPAREAMVTGQIILGVAMAIIYTASLYFGMVLSEGSTEHGGYHEALIGLGGTIGPGAGALTQSLWPGNLNMAVAAVGGVVALSVIASALASVATAKSGTPPAPDGS